MGRWKRSSQVQTLLFDQSRFTTQSAKAWARDHGYKYGKVDRPTSEGRYIRLRQAHPDTFTEMRTISFGDRSGIKAVVGEPRREKHMHRKRNGKRWGVRVETEDTRAAKSAMVSSGAGSRDVDVFAGAVEAWFWKIADAERAAERARDRGWYVTGPVQIGADRFTIGNPAKQNPTDHPVRFYETEFVSGQEPEVDGAYRNDDFATLMETSFDLTGPDVARMLNRQRRVLRRALENLTETQAFYALVNSRQGQEVLQSFKAEAKRLLQEDIDAASDDPGIFRAVGIEVDWYEENQYEFWKADIVPSSLQIRFTVELEVIGTWETR